MGATQIVTSVTIIQSFIGQQAVSLTNYAASALSAIAAGSKLEVAGSFFTWGTSETPNASSFTAIATASTAYLQCTPSGTAGSMLLTSSWTSTAPVWREDKQGWYASAGSSVRVIGSVQKDSPTSQSRKHLFRQESVSILSYGDGGTDVVGNLDVTGGLDVTGAVSAASVMTSGIVEGDGGLRAGVGNQELLMNSIDIGDWNMDTTAQLFVNHGLTLSKIDHISVLIKEDGDGLRIPLDNQVVSAGSGYCWGTATQIVLNRIAGGFFDSASYDATSFNRGRITIWYIP
jgi:hypothetical protein